MMEEEHIRRRTREQKFPKALTDKMMGYVSTNNKRVMITDCENYGEDLLDQIRLHPEVRFTLTTSSVDQKDQLAFAYREETNVTLRVADICEPDFTDQKFDLILSVPEFGRRRMASSDRLISRQTELASLQNLLYHISGDGRLVILLPTHIAFAADESTTTLRKYLEDNYRVEEVNILPEGLLPRTMISTYLFVFANGKTDEITIRQYGADEEAPRGRFQDDQGKLLFLKEAELGKEEFFGAGGWNVNLAFQVESDARKAYENSPVRKAVLGDVAEVFRGKAAYTKTEGGNIGMINISSMTDTGIDYDSIDHIEAEEEKLARYILKDGDVLVATRGTVIKIAVFETQSIPCIPSVNLTVVRPGKELKGTYLKLFLESPVGMELLKGLQRGSTIVNINYNDLAGLEVPVPPLDKQDALAAKYRAGLKIYKDRITTAETDWQSLRQKLDADLF